MLVYQLDTIYNLKYGTNKVHFDTKTSLFA